ncbi:MAG: hypothetical protein ABSE73_22030 [Planctomycetota bacterium]
MKMKIVQDNTVFGEAAVELGTIRFSSGNPIFDRPQLTQQASQPARLESVGEFPQQKTHPDKAPAVPAERPTGGFPQLNEGAPAPERKIMGTPMELDRDTLAACLEAGVKPGELSPKIVALAKEICARAEDAAHFQADCSLQHHFRAGAAGSDTFKAAQARYVALSAQNRANEAAQRKAS